MKEQNRKTLWRGICITFAQIWDADKVIIPYSMYKNVTEAVFDAFLSIYLIKYIYEAIENQTSYHNLFIMVSIFCGVHVVLHITSAAHAYYQRFSVLKIYRSVFGKVIRHAKKIHLQQYENPSFYDNFSRALDETLWRPYWGMLFMTFVAGNIAASAVALSIMASVDPVLILFVIPPVAATLYLGIKESREQFAAKNEETVSKRKMEYAKRVFYEKKYAGELRLYPVSHVLFGLHLEGYQERYRIQGVHQRRIAIYRLIETVFYAGLVTLMAYLYITYRLKVAGTARVASYVAMISATGFVVDSVNSAVDYFSQSGKLCMFMNNLQDFLECETEEGLEGMMQEKQTAVISQTDDPAGAKEPQPEIEPQKKKAACLLKPDGDMGQISFRKVSYHYPGSEQDIIKDFSLEVQSGEHIALVGENGAGKTTLVKLLMGLYPVTSGEIRVGGHEIGSYEKQAYREHFGTVFQDFQIFALTLAENVLMRKPETKEEEKRVIHALRQAQFDVLDRLPGGIDTMLTKEFDEEGYVCSGGQAQKIAIARIFAADPEVVILDEPSSALDPVAEYQMYNNMMKASKGKTVFFISHRMSSARMADRIIYLEHGQIAEEGTHEELMERNGKYARMFRLQAKKFMEEKVS